MIQIKTKQELEIMRQGGNILASVLSSVAKEVKPGVTTEYLNDLAEGLIFQSGALPGFKGYEGYPASLCTSINEQIVHGLPSSRKLKEGDIIGLDLGIIWPPEHCSHCAMNHGCESQRGMYTDAALTVAVGKVSPEAKKIIKAAEGALQAAIDQIKPGRKLSEVSAAIEKYAQAQGFSVIRELVGHGVGYELHEDPEIPNFKANWLKDAVLKEGMVLAIEPMLTAGAFRIKKSKDKHAYETADKSLSSHFEHTVAVTAKGSEILTKI
jgi:methionyl aminopeptidase